MRQTQGAERLWPASIAGGARAWPDHSISRHSRSRPAITKSATFFDLSLMSAGLSPRSKSGRDGSFSDPGVKSPSSARSSRTRKWRNGTPRISEGCPGSSSSGRCGSATFRTDPASSLPRSGVRRHSVLRKLAVISASRPQNSMRSQRKLRRTLVFFKIPTRARHFPHLQSTRVLAPLNGEGFTFQISCPTRQAERAGHVVAMVSIS